MFAKLTAAFALLAPAVHASFILTHSQALSYQRLDPIVTPGAVASHTHSIIGSNAFQPTMDFAQMQTASCTTSPVQDDRSSYWSESLFHRSSNGTFNLIPISFVQTYYLSRDGPTQKKINPFPDGLRMVAGDPFRTTYNASNVADRAISFVCLDYKDSSNDAGPQTAFPQRPCPDGMRMQVNFPSCWDGKNLDSPDHKSHMSYPIGQPDTGDCPATHPVKTVLLFNEYVYDVSKFDFVRGQDSWVTAVGDATGYSFHADFINGWKKETLAGAIDQCTDMIFGDLEKCAPLVPSLDRKKAGACTKPPVVEENLMGPMAKLPGCNPYTGKPVTGPSKCPGLAVPAIIGGPGASTLPAATGSATSASSSATSVAHTVTSSAVASSSAPAASSSAAPSATESAPFSVVTSIIETETGAAPTSTKAATSTAAVTTGAATSTAVATSATASVSSSKHGYHHKHHSATATGEVRPVQTAAKKGSASSCKRNATRDALKASAAANHKRAVRVHHSSMKNRLGH